MQHWWDRFPKKLTALVVGGLVQLLPVAADTKHEITKVVLAYILGQGFADWGKEKAKVEVAALPPPPLPGLGSVPGKTLP